MIGLAVLLVYSLLVSLPFAVLFGRPRDPVGWSIATSTWTGMAVDLLLLLAVLRLRLPLWVAFVVLGLQGAAVTWRLAVLLWERRPG